MTKEIVNDYDAFIQDKTLDQIATGFTPQGIGSHLFDFQEAIVEWACKRGRAAIFADTGLGKTAMQTEWARQVSGHTGGRVLILAPLCVAQQTVEEAARFGTGIKYCRKEAQAEGGIIITNYEMVDHFDVSDYAGVVLDESSILKSHDSKTRARIISMFDKTPYRLSCTATPSPNDHMELGNQAEFLGVMSATEMLAMFFVHDGGDTAKWRLKGHGKQRFWEWMSTWAVCVRNPSDLGFDGSRYILPGLQMHEHTIDVQEPLPGQLFAGIAQTLTERRDAKRQSLGERCQKSFNEVFKSWGNPDLSIGERTTRRTEKNGLPIKRLLTSGTPQHGRNPIEDTGTTWAQKPYASTTEHTTSQILIDIENAGPNSNSAGMDLTKGNSSPCSNPIEAHVPSALVGQSLAECLTLTTITPPVTLEGFSETHATCASDESKTSQTQESQIGTPKPVSTSLRPWLIFCELNDEQDALEKAFGELAFSVRGADSLDDKETRIRGWIIGERPVMISKPSIMGYGLNLQFCSSVMFVSLTDSFESFYQAVRRCYRFGQKEVVNVHLVSSSAEGAVKANLQRKQAQATDMAESMVSHMRELTQQTIKGATSEKTHYTPSQEIHVPSWIKGDRLVA